MALHKFPVLLAKGGKFCGDKRFPPVHAVLTLQTFSPRWELIQIGLLHAFTSGNDHVPLIIDDLTSEDIEAIQLTFVEHFQLRH